MKALVILVLFWSSLGTTVAQSPTNASPPWTRFEWVGLDVGTQHFARAALLVPITIKGIDGVYYLQHDLGSDQTMLDEVPFRQIRNKAAQTNALKTTAVIEGNIGGTDLRGFRIGVKLKYGDPVTPEDKLQVIGTLGLDFFTNRVLLLDYPAQRLAILPGDSALPGGNRESSKLRSADLPQWKVVYSHHGERQKLSGRLFL